MVANMKLRTVQDVALWRLCLGCGACAYVCPEGQVQLIDVLDSGIRPIVSSGCRQCGTCLRYCPGASTSHDAHQMTDKRWGPLLELWEGFAANPEVRFMGSSGGLCSALSMYCMDEKHVGGVLHIGADQCAPWKNKTYLSTRPAEILERTGSRYAPASPCDGLAMIETADRPCVFVGKPCDVAGLRMAQKAKPELISSTHLAIGFFCAGTPSTRGTLDLLKHHNINPESLAELRYRGMGWPGMATVRRKGESEPGLRMTYSDSWGFLQKYRPLRCYLCPDLTAEFADISVGDPWYRESGENDKGSSLILVRTEKGRDILHQALKKGYVKAERVDPRILYRSQKNLLSKRQGIWGRLLAMSIMGIPCPNLGGFHLYENWLDLSLKEKAKSILGTFKRMVYRKYFKPTQKLTPVTAGQTAISHGKVS